MNSQFLLRIVLLLMLCYASAFEASGATAPQKSAGVKLPAYSRVVLPNGTTLLLMEKKDVPLVAFSAVTRGGALADPTGKEGVASLTAELLQKGAGKRNALQFAEAIDNVGGTLFANADREAVVIGGEFLARDTRLVTELLADVTRRPLLPPDDLSKVRDRAIDSLRAAKDSDLRSLIPVYASAFVFGDHPYGHPVQGDENTLAKLTREDVLSYYKSNFGSDRLVIAMVGDFNTTELSETLRKAFADWKKAPSSVPKVTAKKPLQGRRVLLVDKPDATQTYFWIGNIGVRRGDPKLPAIDVANTVFGGRFTSLLNTALRIESGLSYGARSLMSRYAEPGAVGMFSYTQTESTGKAVDLAIDVLTRYRKNGMDTETLASAKSYVLGQFPPDLETGSQLAERLTEIELYGLDRKDVDEYGTAISAATGDEIKAIINTVYPDPANLTFVFIGNAGAIRDAVKKYGPITEMKISDPRFAP